MVVGVGTSLDRQGHDHVDGWAIVAMQLPILLDQFPYQGDWFQSHSQMGSSNMFKPPGANGFVGSL